MRRFAHQLGHPTGVAGSLVGRLLDRANRGPVTGSVEALGVESGTAVADIGFGGGLGLRQLIDKVGPQGATHGIDISTQAMSDARRRFRREIAERRLHLTQAPMDRIPLPGNSLDRAMTVNTLYYVPDEDLRPSIDELARVLRPSGRLVVGLGDPDFMATLPFSAGLRLRPLDEVVTAIVAAGLVVVDHRRVGTSDRAFHVFAAEPSKG